MHVLKLIFCHAAGDDGEAVVLALAADAASHEHLRRLKLTCAPLNIAAVRDAVVDACLTRRLTSVTLEMCNLSPESAPALVRLIGGGALEELDIHGYPNNLLDVPAALVLSNALRASSTLTAVSLNWVGLWRDLGAATALLGALTGHPRLRSLVVSSNRVDAAGQDQAGALIGALVAANAPALHELDVSWCHLGNAGLRPLYDALPRNTHLRTLSCSDNYVTHGFVRERLLPAVRANASLHKLVTGNASEEAREAEALVRRRADAA
jgi:hypothetical protein